MTRYIIHRISVPIHHESDEPISTLDTSFCSEKHFNLAVPCKKLFVPPKSKLAGHDLSLTPTATYLRSHRSLTLMGR